MLGQDHFHWHHIWLLDCGYRLHWLKKEPLTATEAIHRPKLQCCINETLPISCSLPFFPFLWSRFLPFSLIQPGQWGCVQLPRLFSDCRRKSTIACPLYLPHSESTNVSFICLNAVQNRHSQHNVLCGIIIIAEKVLPIPFLSQWHSLKVFLSCGCVTYSTILFHSNLHLFTESLCLLGIVVKARIIFQLFYWANKWHSKVTSENKVQRDWASQD